MRKALLIGVGKYDLMPNAQLVAPPNDARAMAELLGTDDAACEGGGGGIENYDCRVFTTPDAVVDTAFLNAKIDELLERSDDVAFFFAGHGIVAEDGDLHLMAQDCNRANPGISANDLLRRANESPATSVVMILDCCHAGRAGPGNPLPKSSRGGKVAAATLRENRTILAAARADEQSWEEGDQGIFTGLLLDGLRGGAADPRGYVTASSLYGYAEFALGAWDQRPIYKSHASTTARLRRCRARVPDSILLRLPELFPTGQSHALDPSYEWDDLRKDRHLARAKPENVKKFNAFKALRNAGLLRGDNKPDSDEEEDLYFIAMGKGQVHLTGLGRRFWHLAKSGKLRGG